MRTCLFTGSGFSKTIFDQKIQKDFIQDFIDSKESKEFIDFLHPDMKKLMLSIQDPEILISHFFNLAYIGLPHNKSTHPEYKRWILFFRTAIAIYYRNKFREINNYYKNTHLKSALNEFLLALLTAQDTVSVITTNYDLGFERIICDLIGKDDYYYPHNTLAAN